MLRWEGAASNLTMWLLAGLKSPLAADQSHQLFNHMNFSIGLLKKQPFTSPRVRDLREREKGRPKMEAAVFS